VYGNDRSTRWMLGLTLLGSLAGFSSAEASDGGAAPFQASLTEQVQVFAPDESVRGVRIGLISGRNQDVTGYDQVLFASLTDGDQVGVQLSFYAQVLGSLRGLQVGTFRAGAEGDVVGVQLSNLATRSAGLKGVQISSLYNHAAHVQGIQVGLVNDAASVKGVQIGLLNWNRSGLLPLLPLINFGF